MNRRIFLANLLAGIGMTFCADTDSKPTRILLRSSWQTVNIGDIAHTPGMLALLEKHCPGAEITLWPNSLSLVVENMLKTRFPKLKLAKTKNEQVAALEKCDFFLHGSGPGLVGWAEAELAQKAKKPYGFAGITLSDDELKKHRDLLAGAKFIFTRETDSLTALCKTGISGPKMGFGPDATFALDLRDDAAADKLLKDHNLEVGRFLCAVPRLRWTPYWEIYPETVKPNPPKSAINEAFADRDHAKLREAIIAWVTETGMRVFLVPEMTYEVPRLKPLLYDPLPNEIKLSVAVMDRYWLTAEAASVYAKAAAIVSFEMHSPIMAVAAATPAVHLRQPTDSRKGQMWRDIGLENWLFEIDDSTGQEIATRVVEIGQNLPRACQMAKNAREVARRRMAEMVAAIG
ncbi:polysaccharide pyruvyl transferase family protein [Nostoc sp. UHCC 0251]|uniref:polysaccharide pyruvyl transferase family protein n=1 Tax=Nostoc sp. UHCC 0251 TaxID=3110240 RepID=UPI002B20CDC9|nr:polysaccharide pyruvyl transferase family protein [Nostoc sp. UHCC 0251]